VYRWGHGESVFACASTLVRRGEYRAQTGIWRLLVFVSVRTIKGRSSTTRAAAECNRFVFVGVGVVVVVTIYVRRWLCGARMRLSPRTKSLFEAHGSKHPTSRRRWLWRWWRGGKVVGIGVGGGSRRIGEEEAGGLGRRQHLPLVATRLVTGGVCVCVCVCGVYWS